MDGNPTSNDEGCMRSLGSGAEDREGEVATGTMPWPPTVNAIYRAVGGRVIKSKTYRLWKTLARNHLEQQKINQVKPPYQVEIVLSPPDRRRFDIDNRAKVVLDILEDVGYIENDCFVNDIRITRTEPNKENPCAAFMVRHIEEQK